MKTVKDRAPGPRPAGLLTDAVGTLAAAAPKGAGSVRMGPPLSLAQPVEQCSHLWPAGARCSVGPARRVLPTVNGRARM